jgi:ArsR family transcriptional regulator, virulence genes transcriptional regulator
MRIEETQVNARKASVLLKAMSNERRLLILCYLSRGERSVGELESLVALSQSALSQHLSRLRRDRLVRTRRCAQSIYYSLDGDDVPAILATLRGLYGRMGGCCCGVPDDSRAPAPLAARLSALS